MNHEEEMKKALRVGVISDTHGLLRPEAQDALQGCDFIIHAGDIGDSVILKQLGNIAPVIAVRGNTDGGWAYKLSMTEIVEKNDRLIYVIHDLSMMDLDPSAAKISVVVSGHTHKPSVSRDKGVLYINPGSAGPLRGKLPVSVALLEIDGTSIDARLTYLHI